MEFRDSMVQFRFTTKRVFFFNASSVSSTCCIEEKWLAGIDISCVFFLFLVMKDKGWANIQYNVLKTLNYAVWLNWDIPHVGFFDSVTYRFWDNLYLKLACIWNAFLRVYVPGLCRHLFYLLLTFLRLHLTSEHLVIEMAIYCKILHK